MTRNAKLSIFGISGLALTVALLVPAIGADTNETAKDRSAMVREGGERGNREPGSRWEKAAELQKSLTAEEKAKLLARADSAHARGPRGGGPEMKGGMGKGMRGGGIGPLENILTADQKSKVESIRNSYKAKFDALKTSRENGALTPEQFREQTKPLHEAMKAEIDAILTAEQKAQIEQMHEGGRGGRRGKGNAEGGSNGNRERPFGPRTPEDAEAHAARELDAMATALGLTAQQKTTVGALLTSQHDEARKLMEQLRSAGTDREAAHTQLQALRTRHQAALARILNPTQMEIVKIHDAIGGHHKGGHRKGRGPRPDGAANPGTPAPANPSNPGLN